MSWFWVWHLNNGDVARSAAIAQWIAIPLTFLAVAITARATRIASQSAQIASSAMRLSEQTARHQLRAYLGHHSAIVRGLTNRVPLIALTVTNYGQTPAYDVEVFTRHYFGSRLKSFDLKEGGAWRARALGMVGPGQERTIRIDQIDPVSENSRDLLLNVSIVWHDIYAERHEHQLTLCCPKLTSSDMFPREMEVVSDKPWLSALTQDKPRGVGPAKA